MRVHEDPAAVTPPTVAIVLNWNGEHDTMACLDSLVLQRGADFAILLVDNASADGSGARLHALYPGVHYLQTGSNLGYAGGNNRGIAWALGRGARWVLIVNNDTVAEPDCVRRLLAAAQSCECVGALAPLIVRFDAPERIWFAGGTFSRLRALGRHDHEGRLVTDIVRDAGDGEGWRQCSFLTGCCMLLRADALEAVGTFREDFFAYVEDVELSLRLARAGWQLGWVPDARMAHRVPPVGAPPSAMQITLRDRNRRRLVRDLYPFSSRVAFGLWFLPTRLVTLVRYATARDWERFRAILRGMRDR